MGRINGINSDYKMIGGQIKPSVPEAIPPAPLIGAPPLELKLFICPYNQPSALQSEVEALICDGTNATCPTLNVGHALVHLSQTDGIKLTAGLENTVQVAQNGMIALSPTNGQTVQVNGPLVVLANGHTLTITPSAAGITLQHANGAKVVFKPNGDMDLVTKNNTGTVNIQGNLVVSGTLTRQGQQL
jgi:hypothetical protein